MRKILFGLQTMVMGGVEKELIAILHHLDPSEWDITLVVMYIQDESIIKLIPSFVKFVNLDIDRNYYCSDTLTAAKLRLKRWKLREASALVLKKIFGKGQTGSNINISSIPGFNMIFDTAVCFHSHSPLMVKYIAEKVVADKKISWIHNDFNLSGYRADRIKNYLSKYNIIIGVSAKIINEFKNLCPSLAERCSVVYNALDNEEILQKSHEEIPADMIERLSGKLFLLTVGRMEEQKGYDTAVAAAAILKEHGIDFRWAFIGAGRDEQKINSMIHQRQLEDFVFMLGRIDNPYPFMRQCDIYVQPSRHEGYGLTVLEAKILQKPIICTDFAGANEQIVSGKNGLIVPVNHPQKLANAIMELHADDSLRRSFSDVLNSEIESDSGFEKIIRNLK